MLKQCDIFLETPLKYLIDNMPGRFDYIITSGYMHNLCVHKHSLSTLSASWALATYFSATSDINLGGCLRTRLRVPCV